jgi:hypothetical protein
MGAGQGHLPFVPHTMMKGWQDSEGISWEDVVDADLEWLKKCNGFLCLGKSPGSNLELKQAKRLGLRIFYSIEEIPSGDEEVVDHNDSQLQAYLTEYKDCADSYRHTYQTIWQAGAIFIAGSSIIIAWAIQADGFTSLTALLAPLPFLFWYLAIFLPMDAYGKFRGGYLKTIEQKLNELRYQLDVNHYTKYDEFREEKWWGVGIITKIMGWAALIYWISCLVIFIISLFVDFPEGFKYGWPWLF